MHCGKGRNVFGCLLCNLLDKDEHHYVAHHGPDGNLSSIVAAGAGVIIGGTGHFGTETFRHPVSRKFDLQHNTCETERYSDTLTAKHIRPILASCMMHVHCKKVTPRLS